MTHLDSTSCFVICVSLLLLMVEDESIIYTSNTLLCIVHDKMITWPLWGLAKFLYIGYFVI